MDSPTSAPRGAAVDGSNIASGLSPNLTVTSAALHDDTAWLLTHDSDDGTAVWRVEPDKTATKVVDNAAFSDLQPPTTSIAATPTGFVIVGQSCDKSAGSECRTDSGIVDIYKRDGTRTTRFALWHDVPTEAGGAGPKIIGVDGDAVWLRTPTEVVQADQTGKIHERIPVDVSAQTCRHGDDIYRASFATTDADESSPDDVANGPHSITPDQASKASPTTVSLDQWDGSAWKPVDGGSTEGINAPVTVTCNDTFVAVWSADRVAATWSTTQGWRQAPESITSLPRAKDLSGLMQPTSAPGGGIYVLDDAFHVRMFDAAAGKLVDTGLTLQPTAEDANTFVHLAVAESDRGLFACAGRATGLAGGPTEPGTTCGFAPRPS